MSLRSIKIAVWSGLLVLAVWTSFIAANLFWHTAGHVAIDDAAPASIVIRRDIAPESADIAAILALAPFGKPAAMSNIQAVNAKTDNLKLLAVRVSDEIFQSTATIVVEREPAAIFRVGEDVVPGAAITSISKNSVTLRMNGADHILTFPDKNRPAALSGVYAEKAAKYGTVPNSEAYESQDANTIIDSFRQQISANPETLLNQYDLSPSQDGYVVGENAPSVLLRAGLRAGDRVVRVNGNAVGNVESDRRLFETIVASGRARVELIRNDRPIILSFPLR